jgi:hypothetical protein
VTAHERRALVTDEYRAAAANKRKAAKGNEKLWRRK